MSETKLLLNNIIIIVKLFNVIIYTIKFYTTLGTLIKFRQILFLFVEEELPLFQKAVTRKQAGNFGLCASEVTKKVEEETRL